MRDGVLIEAGATISPGRERSRGSFTVTITISKDSMRLPGIARRAELDGLKEKMRKLGFKVVDSFSAREFDVVVKASDAKQAQKKTSDGLVKARRSKERFNESLNEAKRLPLIRAVKDVLRDLGEYVKTGVSGGEAAKAGADRRLSELKKGIIRGGDQLLTAAKNVVDDLERFNRTQGAGPVDRLATLKASITRSILGETKEKIK